MYTCIFGVVCLTEFPTSQPELEAVADKFDKNKNGYIDYKEFMMALRTDVERDVSIASSRYVLYKCCITNEYYKLMFYLPKQHVYLQLLFIRWRREPMPREFMTRLRNKLNAVAVKSNLPFKKYLIINMW